MALQRTGILFIVCAVLAAGTLSAQNPVRNRPRSEEESAGAAPAVGGGAGWRAPGGGESSPRAADGEGSPGRETPLQPLAPRGPLAKVTAGSGSLPNEHGQIWREYDISPYTARVTSTARPEQAIVDWILRETGYEAWHGETVAVLSANRRVLRAYHTAEVQTVVGDLVDRFVNTEAQTFAFGVRVVSLDSPGWRAKAQRMLRPIQVQTPGIQAWALAREDAALLVGELRKRADFREHSAPHLMVANGQTAMVAATRARNYIRSVRLTPDPFPGFQAEPGQMDEGYSLEMSPLVSLDGRTIDAIIKCNLDQIERLQPVMLDVPTAAAPRQRTQVDVPQLSSFRLHERFRWPSDQVLLIGCGMVAPPMPLDSGIKIPLVSPPARVDLLVFVESRGTGARPVEVGRLGSPAGRLPPR